MSQQQRDGLTLKYNVKGGHQGAAETGHFQLRSRLKTVSTSSCILRRRKLQAGLMCSDYLSPSFGWLLRVLATGISPGFLASVVLSRTRGFRDLNSVNLYQQQPVFLSSYVFYMFDVLHTVINSENVQNLTTEQATSVVTDFFAGL